MAIGLSEFSLLLEGFRRNCYPKGGSILEFGESMTIVDVNSAISMIHGDTRPDLYEAVKALEPTQKGRFDAARLIYRALFDYSSYTALDLTPPSDHSIQQDLNVPFTLPQQYDVCINNGTTEHVFNLANAFKAIHDHTKKGGVMIHWTPCMGWVNHGLFNIQPCFFHDLSAANDYEMLFVALNSLTDLLGPNETINHLYDLRPTCRIPDEVFEAHPYLKDSMLCAILRKTSDAPFRIPLQGAYSHLKVHAQEFAE